MNPYFLPPHQPSKQRRTIGILAIQVAGRKFRSAIWSNERPLQSRQRQRQRRASGLRNRQRTSFLLPSVTIDFEQRWGVAIFIYEVGLGSLDSKLVGELAMAEVSAGDTRRCCTEPVGGLRRGNRVFHFNHFNVSNSVFGINFFHSNFFGMKNKVYSF